MHSKAERRKGLCVCVFELKRTNTFVQPNPGSDLHQWCVHVGCNPTALSVIMTIVHNFLSERWADCVHTHSSRLKRPIYKDTDLTFPSAAKLCAKRDARRTLALETSYAELPESSR